MAVIAVTWLTLGCASEITEYPSKWSPVSSAHDCSALAGVYRDGGERASISPQRGQWDDGYWFLTQLTTGHETLYSGSNGATLSFPEPGVLAIKGGAERRFSFESGEAACVNGRLELRRAWSDREYRGATWWTTTIVLSRATDGWLIAEFNERETALRFWIVPARMELREWYRFQPISDSVAALAIPSPPPRNIWTKNGTTSDQITEDSQRCGRDHIGERFYERCMASKGWLRVDVPGRPGYPRRGGAYNPW